MTDEKKFNNWLKYGNPEGTLSQQVIGIALPKFLFDMDNQIWLLIAIFIVVIVVPLVLIRCITKPNSIKDMTFLNGI